MKYGIKPCEAADYDLIFGKDLEAYEDLVPAEKGVEAERLVLKIADNEGVTIGGCVMGIDKSKKAELERLWVDENHRRRGLGFALINEAERAAYEKGCRTIINAYCFDFQDAKLLFEKMGYKLLGAIEDWPKGHENYTFIKRFDGSKSDIPCKKSTEHAGFKIVSGSEADAEFISDRLEEYNATFAPRTHPYIDLDKKLVDEKGNVIAGCIAGVSGWDALHIDVLWVDEPCRDQGADAYLLSAIEREARAMGAYIARAGAPEFQSAFYIGHGYSQDVIFEGDPKWYYLSKRL